MFPPGRAQTNPTGVAHHEALHALCKNAPMSAIVGLIGMLGLGALFLGPIAAALAGREAAQTFFGLGIVLMVLCSVLAVIGQVFGLMR